MRRPRLRTLLAVALPVLLIAAFVGGWTWDTAAADDGSLRNVELAGEDVVGLTEEEVAAVVAEQAVAFSQVEVAIATGRGEPLDIGSVCHGAGVLDHALHEGLAEAGVGSRLSFAVDIDADAMEASLRNSGLWDDRSMAVQAPMQDVDPGLLPRVEIVTGGLPCVGASKAGKAKNGIASQEQHPEAGALFVTYLFLIKIRFIYHLWCFY